MAKTFTVGRSNTPSSDHHPLRRDHLSNPPSESLLDKVMRTRRQLENKRGAYFTPKEGINRVRIMPSWRGVGEQFYVSVPTHKNIGPDNKWATCLQFWGEDCLIDHEVDRLMQSHNSRDQNAASKMMAEDRILVNVGYPNEEDGVIKVWSLSESWFLEILGYFGDADYGDFTHPIHGFDYTFTRKGTGLKTRYSNKGFAREPSRVIIADARKKIINLEAFPTRYTRQQLRAFLRGEEADE